MFYLEEQDIMLGQPVYQVDDIEESSFSLFGWDIGDTNCRNQCLATGEVEKLPEGGENPKFTQCMAQCKVDERKAKEEAQAQKKADKKARRAGRAGVDWNALIQGLLGEPSATEQVPVSTQEQSEDQLAAMPAKKTNYAGWIVGIILVIAVIALIAYLIKRQKGEDAAE